MTTLNSTSILASIIAQNPYHIISIQGQMPMSHAENTYDFEIAEDDPHYDDMVNYSADMLWVYTYADKESLELDLMENIYHSLEDNQDRAYQDLIDQVNDTYGDGGILQFKTMKGIKNYFDSIAIETQELTPIGFKNTLLNRETK